MLRRSLLAALALATVAWGTSVVGAQPGPAPPPAGQAPTATQGAPGATGTVVVQPGTGSTTHVRRGQPGQQPATSVVGQPAPAGVGQVHIRPAVPVPGLPSAAGQVVVRPGQPVPGQGTIVRPGQGQPTLLQVPQPPTPGQNIAIAGEAIVILALEAPGAIDASIANEPALRQPAFQVFRTMRLLARPQLSLTLGQPTVVELPNGRRMQIVVVQRMPNGRYELRVSINRPGQTDYLPSVTVVLSPGAPFFQVGQSFQGGTLVIGVRVGARPAGAGVQVAPGTRRAVRRKLA